MNKNARRQNCRISCLFYVLCFLYPYETAFAQTLGLREVVESSMSNFPQLQQRQSEIKEARAHERTVADNYLPSLLLQNQLDLGTTNSLPGSYFPLGVVPSTSGGSSTGNKNILNQGDIAISYLQWEFFNFGYYKAQQKEATAQTAIFEAKLTNDKYLVTLNVVAAYIDWLKKFSLLQIENENVARSQVIYNSIKAGVLSGLKPGVDTSTALATLSGARLSYLRALEAYNYDKISLSYYTGLNIDGYIPDTTIAPTLLLSQIALLPKVSTIEATHPLLNVYKKQYEAQLFENDATSKKCLPKLTLDGAAWMRGTGFAPDGAKTDGLAMPYSRYNYLIGFTIGYNLFDIRHRQDQLLEGQFKAEAIDDNLRTQSLTLNSLLKQVESSLTITLENLKEIPFQKQAAEVAYNQQMALYRAGLNTLIEITNAQYVLMQSETNYVIAQNELLMLLYMRAGLSGQSETFLQKFK